MDGRGNRGVVVGRADSNSAGSNERSSELLGRRNGLLGLKDTENTYRDQEQDAEDNILDEAVLGTGNSGRIHRDAIYVQIHSGFLYEVEDRILLGRFFKGKGCKDDLKA
jgi:hypothetical protein